ncbi:hypothetical protein DEDE109153_03925 [Deinococcus deserti]|uniref:Uncharacterized protein n=1 Tax=Deinococcus deserti (strain DSM 17065 / CIP 109153 / LMG 22923 / VCD115) TaxID=546414 RepID=C1D0M9_DEIDV|nr:hypothetical protein [Deinococcus deserti]ACO45403.2 Hypothetical protein Deide_05650 [Deinococcus deserti VCD115]
MRFSHSALVNLTFAAVLVAGSAQAEGSGSSIVSQLAADASGSAKIISELRPDVDALVKHEFDQSLPQHRAAVRAALVLQAMSNNPDPTSAELSRHLQLHLITSFCLKRTTQGSDAVRDSLLKKLKEMVLNTDAREKNYQRYLAAAKTINLKLATDNDCAELDK